MKKSRQLGNAHVIIALLVTLALLAVLGFLLWRNLTSPSQSVDAPVASTSQKPQDTTVQCADGEDVQATSRVFCSEEYGVKFDVPELFIGRLGEVANEPMYAAIGDSKQLGMTDSVLSAQVKQGSYDYSLKVSLLPQIDNVSLGLIAAGQFDANDKKVYSILTKADSNSFYRDKEYQYVTTEKGIKVYRDTFGDVGNILFTNVVVTESKIVVIDLRASPNSQQDIPEEAPAIDDARVLQTITLL